MKRRTILLSMLAATLVPSTASYGYDWEVMANVTVVEVSYLPDRVSFQIDAAAGPCASGTWLVWNAQGSDAVSKSASSQGVVAGLLTAKSGHTKIRAFGFNSDCSVEFLHIL